MTSRDSPPTKPRISVIIPLYNGQDYIAEALDSIFAQTYPASEVIVVDDGSSDGSGKILDRYAERIHRITQKNAGTAAARNAGVSASTGEMLAFLDQDDYWAPEKLQKQVEAIHAAPDTRVAWGMIQQFFSPEVSEAFKARYRCQKEPIPGYLPAGLLIDRETFHQIGLFDPQWKIGEWADWYARYKNLAPPSVLLPDTIAFRRIHEANKGITMSEDRKEYLRLIKANLLKKRQQ